MNFRSKLRGIFNLTVLHNLFGSGLVAAVVRRLFRSAQGLRPFRQAQGPGFVEEAASRFDGLKASGVTTAATVNSESFDFAHDKSFGLAHDGSFGLRSRSVGVSGYLIHSQ